MQIKSNKLLILIGVSYRVKCQLFGFYDFKDLKDYLLSHIVIMVTLKRKKIVIINFFWLKKSQ